MAGQPSALKDLRRRQVELEADAIAFSMSPDIEARRRQREYYLANVTMIDEKLGEILEALETKGLLNNTIVIFTSDHGDTLGDHGQSQKWTMYEQVLRVPLVFWGAGLRKRGRQSPLLSNTSTSVRQFLTMRVSASPNTWRRKAYVAFLAAMRRRAENWFSRSLGRIT
jgi:arylsulfatase